MTEPKKRKKYTQPRQTAFVIEQANHDALREMAKAANTSMSAVVNSLIAQAAAEAHYVTHTNHATNPS